MNRSLTLSFPYKLLIPAVAFLSLVGFALLGNQFVANSNLTIGVTLDFCFTIPLLYFLAIRKSSIPKITVLTVFVFCLFTATVLIPESEQLVLSQIKFYAIPLVELGVFTFIVIKAGQIIVQMKTSDHAEWYDGILKACDEIFPSRIGAVLATELSVIYYSFFSWRAPIIKENHFTYFKKNGIKSVIGAFVFVILIETIAVHLLVGQWSVKVAWILSALSIYTCFQLFALVKSMNRRLSFIDYKNQTLNLRYGFFNHVKIPIRKIETIESNRRTLPDDKSILQFSPLGMLDSHNIILTLNEDHTMNRMYGLKKEFKKLAIYIDDKEKFIHSIKGLMSI